MPLQNRVDPFGNLFRTHTRGTLMGNRGGVIHNEEREIVRPFKSARWITCLLEFKGWHRVVMTPRRYTELFFLDEAVAFAAGHRPCAECRRERFNAFRNAWQQRHHPVATLPLRAPEIDAELHLSRISNGTRKVTFEAALNSLPNGCFVEHDGGPCLVWDDSLVAWAAEGYIKKLPRRDGLTVRVLTPQPIVECFRQGYVPGTHDSLRDL